MKRKMYTLGYSGYDIEGFVCKLLANDIECLIDVREIPISRKKGFAKNALMERLAESGIEYRHHKALGSPKDLRHKVREDRDYSTFFSGVRKHLLKPTGVDAVRETIHTAREMRSCLMCFCPEWENCHRSCVVESILASSYFSFEHLGLNEDQGKLWTGKAA